LTTQYNIFRQFWYTKFEQTYRHIDKATGVLSFHYYEDFSGLRDEDIAGELIFCEEKIVSQ